MARPQGIRPLENNMRRNYTWLLFLVYFGIFVVLGVIFYYKYLDQFLLPGAKPPEVDIVAQSQIYFSSPDGLYRTNPEYVSTGALINAAEKIQATTSVTSIDVLPGKTLAYAASNQAGYSEIWQMDLKSNQSEIIGRTTENNNFLNFEKPRFDPSGGKLAYLAKSEQKDTILINDIESGKTTDLTSAIDTKISDFSWDKTGKKIIFCTKNPTSNYCEALETASGKNLGTFTAEVDQIYWNKGTTLYYLENASDTANIYSLSDITDKPVAITKISNPKTIVDFSLSSDGNTIAYEVKEGGSSEIYVSKTDGSNLIQLTQDSKSREPQISPDGKLVAFLKEGDGIYLIGVDKLNEKKLLNLSGEIRLLAWR